MGRKITKRKELYDLIYEKLIEMNHYYSKEKVYWLTKAFIEVLIDITENGDELYLREVFSIKPKLKKEHKVGNFGNGEPMIIPEHYVVDFRPGARMKRACENLMLEKQQEKTDDDE